MKKTLNVALEGLELALKDDDSASQGYFFRKIADAYNYLNEKDKAIYYAKKRLQHMSKHKMGFYCKSILEFRQYIARDKKT
ncbi:hypothetical protein P4S63_23685 [Pseudoalteromonas sp. B193]